MLKHGITDKVIDFVKLDDRFHQVISAIVESATDRK